MRIFKLLFLVLLVASFSFAATNVSTCQVINSSGEYELNTSLEGAPVLGTPSGTACIRINASDVSLNCTGYEITNNGTGGTTIGINIGAGISNVSVVNCPNVAEYSHGIYIAASNDVTLRNNTAFNNSMHGFILISNSNNNLLENNSAVENGFHGFRSDSSSYNVFENNTARDNIANGFYIIASSSFNNFTDNEVYRSGASGLFLESGTNNTLLNNDAYNNSRDGFSISSSANNTLTSNNAYNNTYYGFNLTSTDDNALSSNTAYENPYGGILLDSSSNNDLIGNTAYTAGLSCIRLDSSSDYNELAGNDAYNCSYGINLYSSSYNNLTSNNGYNNSAYGFILQVSANNNRLITNNAYNITGTGFDVLSAHNNTFIGNNAYNNTQNGFRLEISSNDNSFTSDTAANNSGYGLYIHQSNNTNVTAMHIYNNDLGALYVTTDSTPRTFTLTGVDIDSPSGNLANYTRLTLSDTVEANSAYSINWSTNSTALPADSFSFLEKFIDITIASGTVSIDSIVWNWLQSEVSGFYDEVFFELWNYNTTWTDTSATLDTSANTLTLTSLNPAGTYGILQYNDTQGPNVTLNSPSNGYTDYAPGSLSILFSFTATDNHYTTMNCSLYLDGSLRYNNTVLNNTPDTVNLTVGSGTHTWNVNCSDPANNSNSSQIYSLTINQYTISSAPSAGKKSLSASIGQICPGDNLQVNVTSGASPLANTQVRLIYLDIFDVKDKITDSQGSVLFNNLSAGQYKLRVTKSGYSKAEETMTYSACPTVEKPVEKPPVKPPVTPPPVTPPANITIPPSVKVSDQKLTDSSISVDNAYLDKSGCVVIHLVTDGKAGAVVGKSTVFSGNKTSMVISLVNYTNETNLVAMLHYDDGDGVCDPTKDKPATVNGKPVTTKFKVTLPPAAPPTKPTEPTKPVTKPPAEPEKADDFMGILLMLLLLLILLGGAAAAYYFFGRKKGSKYSK